jgi:iron(III) transport system ATP-binding protein
MRVELVRLQKEIGTTSLYVTHDQAEAMVVSDRIIIMNLGRIIQEGTAHEIYFEPANRFVAEFIGEANFFGGRVTELREGKGQVAIPFPGGHFILSCSLGGHFQKDEEITLCVRPEDIELIPLSNRPDINCLQGEVSHIHFMGNYTDCRVKAAEIEVKVRSPKFQPFQPGDPVSLKVEPEMCVGIKKV